MVPRSLAGITVSLFKPHKPDTCLIRLRESACTVQLLIISWEEILLVSEIVKHLISIYNQCIVKPEGVDNKGIPQLGDTISI